MGFNLGFKGLIKSNQRLKFTSIYLYFLAALRHLLHCFSFTDCSNLNALLSLLVETAFDWY